MLLSVTFFEILKKMSFSESQNSKFEAIKVIKKFLFQKSVCNNN